MSPSYILESTQRENSNQERLMSNITVSIVPNLSIQSSQSSQSRQIINGEYINIPFKLTTNGEKFYLDINTEIKLCELKGLINEQVLNNFRLSIYDIVQVGTELGENGPVVNTESEMKLGSYLDRGRNFAAFYIRPVNLEPINHSDSPLRPINFLTQYFRTSNLDNIDLDSIQTDTFYCVICFRTRRISSRRRLIRCTHEFCINCINQWTSSNNQNSQRNNCPICRRFIE